VACAGLLHDAVEDHAAGIAPGGRQAALAVLAGRFGTRTAALVAAVTNPAWEPGRDKHEQYREHVLAALQASPWARVIKASALRVLILRPDTPLEDDVKGTIAAQLDAAQARLAAIRHDHHGAVPLLPGPAPGAKPGTLEGETA
jgi:hypothetical protein